MRLFSKKAGIVGILLLFAILFILAGFIFIYYNPDFYNPESFVIIQNESIVGERYGENISEMLFYPNMRFRSKEITYSIDDSCEYEKKDKTHSAFEILSNETVLNFVEVENGYRGEIMASCSEKKQLDEDYFIAGEGGPLYLVDSGDYVVIYNGSIFLYEDKCDKPIVSIHEILHVLGFQHVNNPKSIMYNYSSCDQKITLDIIEVIENLYEDPTLPNLVLRDVSAVKKGRYLDFNVTVMNEGLKISPDLELVIYGDDKKLNSYEIEGLGIGAGKTLAVQNMKGFYGLEKLIFVVDEGNLIKEINEDNSIELVVNK
jgi:hypothetical protein